MCPQLLNSHWTKGDVTQWTLTVTWAHPNFSEVMQESNSERVYLQKTKSIRLNITYLVFVLYSVDYSSKAFCTSLHSVFDCFTQLPNFFGVGVVLCSSFDFHFNFLSHAHNFYLIRLYSPWWYFFLLQAETGFHTPQPTTVNKLTSGEFVLLFIPVSNSCKRAKPDPNTHINLMMSL